MDLNNETTEYKLLDSGDGEKLERFGEYLLRRPDPMVLWQKSKPTDYWNSADAWFRKESKSFKWFFNDEPVKSWQIDFAGLTFNLKINNFKHIGLFPEQISNWQFMEEIIKETRLKSPERQIRVLNLFGYAGGASLYLAKLGVDVVHIDSSLQAIDLAKENQKSSDLSMQNIRFIVDDVRKFVEREIRRGAVYDAIIMDPPVYGKGNIGKKNKSEWSVYDDLVPLLEKTKKLLSKEPLFVCLSGYASEFSHMTYRNVLSGVFGKKGKVFSDELYIKELSRDFLLPAGIFARIKF